MASLASFMVVLFGLVAAPLAAFRHWLPKRRLTIGGLMAIVAAAGAILGVFAQAPHVPLGLWWLAALGLYAMPFVLIGLYAPKKMELALASAWAVIAFGAVIWVVLILVEAVTSLD